MASQLTSIAVNARRGIRYGIYGIVFILIARVAINFALTVYRTAVPPKAPPPTVGFGQLDTIDFPDPTVELPSLEFTVGTSSGFLPEFPEQMPVYAMPQRSANLFSFETMNQRAGVFGFTRSPFQISERIYRFNHPRVPAELEADIVTEVFSISFNLAADSSPLDFRAPNAGTAQGIVTSRLKNAEILPKDLEEGVFEHEFLKVEGQNLVRALAQADAQLVQINIFRKPFGEEGAFPVVTANPRRANVWFIVSGSEDREKQVIAGEYKYFPVDTGLVETYPIKTAEQAIQELVSGGGYIANLGLNIDGKITIRQIYLAYFDPNVPSSFMQPVVVLEGEDDFLAYVPAVTNEYLESQN